MRTGIGALVLTLIIALAPATIYAEEWGAEYAARVEVEGFGDPVDRRMADPCAGFEGYPASVGYFKPEVRNQDRVVEFSTTADGSGDQVLQRSRTEQGANWSPVAFDVEYRLWHHHCEETSDDTHIKDTDNQAEIAAGSAVESWVRVPSTQSLLPDLVAEAYKRLTPPQFEWPTLVDDPIGIYVKVEMGFRIQPVEPFRLEANISNIARSASAWVTGDPTVLTVTTNEPKSEPVQCSYPQAISPLDPEQPGACAYTFKIASHTVDKEYFTTTATLTWEINTSAGPLNPGTSWWSDSWRILEIQTVGVAND